jgi:hypothetical protein
MLDPYEIINRHIEAIGGWEYLNRRNSLHAIGTIDYVGAGLSGKYQEWKAFSEDTCFFKTDKNLGVFSETINYDGSSVWKKDNHGKVTNISSEDLLTELIVKRLTEKYAFANRESKQFKLSAKRNKQEYIVTVQNVYNKHVLKYYFNRSTLLINKRIDLKTDQTEIRLYNDYRCFDRTMLPFEIIVELPENQETQHIKIDRYEARILPALVFQAPHEDTTNVQFSEDMPSTSIPFDCLHDLIYLSVFINGRKGTFIVDSAAGKSVLDTRFALELGLEQFGSLNAHGAGSASAAISFAQCETIEIENLKLIDQTVVVLDFTGLFASKNGIEVSGLLGFDFLSRVITRIDFVKSQIVFYNPKYFIYKGSGSVIPAYLVDNVFKIPVVVDQIYSGFWRVDTGAKISCFHYPFAKKNKFARREGLENIGEGIGGKYKSKRSQFMELEIGGFKLQDPVIKFPLEPMKGAFGAKSIIGNLGLDMLRHFIVLLNYRDNCIILEKMEGKQYETS